MNETFSSHAGAAGYALHRDGGYFTCPCCGDVAICDTITCAECIAAECEETEDSTGDLGFWECRRVDTDVEMSPDAMAAAGIARGADAHVCRVAEIYSIPDMVMGAGLVRGAQVSKCSCGRTLSYEPRS